MKCLKCDGELHPVIKDGESYVQCDKCGAFFTRHDLKYHTPTPQPQTQPQSHQSAPPQPKPNGDDKGKRYNIGRVAAVIGWTLCVLFLIFGLATGGVSLIIFLIAALLINPIFRNHVYISGKIWIPLVIVLFIAGMATAPTTDTEPKKVTKKQEAPAASVKKQTEASAEKQTKKASEAKKAAKEKAKKEKQERAAQEQAEREEKERIAQEQAEQEKVASKTETQKKEDIKKDNSEEAGSSDEQETDNKISSGNYEIDGIDVSFSDSVRNDVTGRWRLSRVATSRDIIEYAQAYHDTLFSSDDEVHAVVNFTLNTTTCLSMLTSDLMNIQVTEYVDKEEHDASKLFSGSLLAIYHLTLSTGQLEKIQ